MGDYVDELCESYSQGMKQRVVFASALVHDPRVLVVDEPLVGLDPRSARIVKDLFVQQARSGCAVLMSTHLLAIAEELADRIGIVDHGRMLASGTLDQLRTQVQHHGPLEELFLKLTGDRSARPSPACRIPPPSPSLPGRHHEPRHPQIRCRPLSAPLPPCRPTAPPAALRQLRWCLTRNTVRSILAGSRLRLSMILICSAIFWLGLFGLFLGRLRVHGDERRAVQRDLRIPVQHVLPVDPGDALLLDGDHHLHGAVPLARGDVPADDAGDRPTGSSPTSSPRRSGCRAGGSSCWAAR